jgi:hypothetical protein
MANYCYLDIETTPAVDGRVIADIEDSIAPPANYSKPETIEKWAAEVKPKLVQDAVAQTSFNGAWGSVCCIGWAWNTDPAEAILRTGTEADMLRSAFKAIEAGKPKYGAPTIVGHNVISFDIKFLWQRCFILGVRAPTWLPRDVKPWGNEVQDTMSMFAGFKDRISLDKLCQAMGLPGKGAVKGTDVAGMWERGEHEAIAAYCRDDVDRVRSVHRRMLVATGELEPSIGLAPTPPPLFDF